MTVPTTGLNDFDPNNPYDRGVKRVFDIDRKDTHWGNGS
jgi:hypothetical protein